MFSHTNFIELSIYIYIYSYLVYFNYSMKEQWRKMEGVRLIGTSLLIHLVMFLISIRYIWNGNKYWYCSIQLRSCACVRSSYRLYIWWIEFCSSRKHVQYGNVMEERFGVCRKNNFKGVVCNSPNISYRHYFEN